MYICRLKSNDVYYLTVTILMLAAAAAAISVVSGFRMLAREKDRDASGEGRQVVRIRRVPAPEETERRQPEAIPFTEEELAMESGSDAGTNGRTAPPSEAPEEDFIPQIEERPEEAEERPLRKGRVNRKNSKRKAAGQDEDGPDRPLELFDEFTY